MNIEEIDIKDIEFGEPIEEKEPNYRDGYIRGIYRARNIIDSKQKEIERLNNRIEKAKHFIDQVLGYHLSSGYEQLDKDVNELYGILMGTESDKE